MIDFAKETAFVHRVLDATSLRTNVILHNLANANTPGFKRYEVRFEDELRAAQARGKSVRDVHPRVVRDESGKPGANNVSPMHELSQLRKVELIHEMFARRMGGYFGRLNKAIAGRG